MAIGLVPEEQFLKEIVVREFNFQYKQKYDSRQFKIKSVRPKPGYTHGYEVYPVDKSAIRTRLFLFFTIGQSDSVGEVSLATDGSHRSNSLEDEVFVVHATIDSMHTYFDGYRFAWIDGGEDQYFFKQVDGKYFGLQEGGFLVLV